MSDRFPIQGGLTVSMEAAERAYKFYVRKFGHGGQSLERLGERGGFCIREFAWLYCGARDDEMHQMDENKMARALAEADIRRK